MMLFLESLDVQLPEIVIDGPFVPKSIIPVAGGPDDTPLEVRTIEKPKAQWSDEDKRLVALDSKARNNLAISLPDDVCKQVEKLKSAKEVWDTLCTVYEGPELTLDNMKTILLDSMSFSLLSPKKLSLKPTPGLLLWLMISKLLGYPKMS